MTNEELWAKIERGLTNLMPYRPLTFAVQIVEHCNLNCKQCNHLSPLAEEEYLDIESYKKDLGRLSELFDREMSRMTLTGGEPLLHPQVTEFMRIAREAFPIGHLMLMTNGLLLPTMPEDFWEACKKYDVTIVPTCYPVKVDYVGLKKIADSKGIKYISINSEHSGQSKTYPIRSSTPYTDISRINFLNCYMPRCAWGLKNGKMYPCTMAINARHLKKYFNLDMHLSEKNCVDIYSVKSGDELMDKMARPIPLCQHCDVTDATITCNWGISKKDRYEWLAFEFTEADMQYLKSNKPVVYVFGAGRWGTQTVNSLKDEGIMIKSVLATRKKQGADNILGVPIVTLDELTEVEPDSICLVALRHHSNRSEVYPLLSKIGFGDVVPVFGVEVEER